MDAELAQALRRSVAELVTPQRGEQRCLPGQARQLHRRDTPTSGGLLEGAVRVDHLARARHMGHTRELHPLDVAHHRHLRPAHPHGGSLTQFVHGPIDLTECRPWRAPLRPMSLARVPDMPAQALELALAASIYPPAVLAVIALGRGEQLKSRVSYSCSGLCSSPTRSAC